MRIAACLALTAASLCVPPVTRADGTEKFTPQTVIVERFEARDAALADVLDALTILAENSTGGAWHPSIVLADEKVGARRITLKVIHQALAAAIDEAARLAGASVRHTAKSIIIGEKKS